MSSGRPANRLIREKSPYLLQHAHNPVDWYPWGDEAFDRARREDKPVFLSVGYSTCHWCHVMERESFEDPEIAGALNRWFVPVKVDREERPDVDRAYMPAAAALTGAGGWPLSVFLAPDGKPFFAGTYFPPVSRYGRPGFLDVLNGVHEAWQARRGEIEASAVHLADAIGEAMQVEPETTGAPAASRMRADSLMRAAYRRLDETFDERRGGFGGAPKFPQPACLFLLLREWAARGEARARDMALVTLRRMATGGIHDHVGGGFHRYSTDAEWRVPHFEKMLYDQAQLAAAYLEAYQVGGDRFFAAVARDVLDYVARDLTRPEGGFCSAEDADSPGADGALAEGAFYAWTTAEIEALLGAERAAPFLRHFGCTAEGNLEGGGNVLCAADPIEETAARFGLTGAELERRLAADLAALVPARAARPRPSLDDKVLTAWNGLMISAFARGHQVLGDPRDLERARRAADFVWRSAGEGRPGTLRRRWRDGEAAIPGELSDYACFAQGLLDLYEAGFDVRDLERALALTDRQVELFWDEARGGFFDTAEADADRRLARGKEAHDGAEPSGNSVAVANLVRLARMTGRADLEEKARRTVELFAGHAARAPLALAQMWVSASLLSGPPAQVVIAGRPGAPDTQALLDAVRSAFLPNRVVLLADGGHGQRWLAERLGFLRGAAPVDGHAAAYMCEDGVCRPPVLSGPELARRLGAANPTMTGS